MYGTKFDEWLVDQKLEAEQEKKVCDILNMTIDDAADWLDELKTKMVQSADRSSFNKMMETLPYLTALDYAIDCINTLTKDKEECGTIFSDMDTDPGLPNDGILIIAGLKKSDD